jgi:hypothetical protein
MDILPIQASAVPCERVFSSAKETMSARRSRISSDLMEYLQILKYSLRKGRGLNFTTHFDWDVELAYLTNLSESLSSVPEDLDDFRKAFGQRRCDLEDEE